jgi:hypothetical protein
VKDAVRSLHRESTPGTDLMPLDFYIENLHSIAPQLSALFGPAQVGPAHGTNAGRDAPDMASISKRSMCGGSHVAPP